MSTQSRGGSLLPDEYRRLAVTLTNLLGHVAAKAYNRVRTARWGQAGDTHTALTLEDRKKVVRDAGRRPSGKATAHDMALQTRDMAFKTRDTVRVFGLVNSTQHNGRIGTVLGRTEGANGVPRFQVRCDLTLALRPSNLELVSRGNSAPADNGSMGVRPALRRQPSDEGRRIFERGMAAAAPTPEGLEALEAFLKTQLTAVAAFGDPANAKARSVLGDLLQHVRAERVGFAVHNGVFAMARKLADALIEACCVLHGVKLQPIPHKPRYFNHHSAITRDHVRLGLEAATVTRLKFLRKIGLHGLHGFSENGSAPAGVLAAKASFVTKLNATIQLLLAPAGEIMRTMNRLMRAPQARAPTADQQGQTTRGSSVDAGQGDAPRLLLQNTVQQDNDATARLLRNYNPGALVAYQAPGTVARA